MENLKAVIYIRVSDESQIKNNSLETQLKSCQNFADTHKLDVVEVFREEGVSAKHIHTRPEMRRLLQVCTVKKNGISRVIVYKMDRWTRNVEEGLAAMSLLAKTGVQVVPATEIAEQNSMGKAMRTILMALGELDNSLKSERVRDTMNTMFKKGLWCWKPPLGYVRPKGSKEERKGKPPVFDKNLAPLIKLLFEKAASGYYTKIALAEYLNLLNFKQFYGREANGKLIKGILSNPFYYGYMYANRWNEYVWGNHKKLVEQDVWEKAFYNTLGKKKMLKHQDSKVYPLKGTIKCATCSHPMTSSNPTGRKAHYLYYECHNKACGHKERIDVEGAHQQFISLLGSVRPSQRVLKLFTQLVFDEWNETIRVAEREAKLRDEQIARLEAKLVSVAESNSKCILTDEEAKTQAEKVRQDIAVLRVERSDIRIEQYDTEAVKGFTESFLTNLDRLWLELDLSQKQTLQNEIFPKGVLSENRKIRTAGLAQSFALIDSLKDENVNLVIRVVP